MKRRLSTRSPDIGVVDMLVDTAADAARAQSGLCDSSYAIRFKRSGLSERRDKARLRLISFALRSDWEWRSQGGWCIDTNPDAGGGV
jgi:hypothetical protein